MKNLKQFFSVMFFVGMVFFLNESSVAQVYQQKKGAEGIMFTSGSWKNILDKAKKTNKYIFVDAYATWCGPCKLLKSSTFKDKNAGDYFNKNFINYAVDMEKGEGPQLAEQWAIEAYPTLMIFDKDGKMILKKIGYVKAQNLIDLGKKALAFQ